MQRQIDEKQKKEAARKEELARVRAEQEAQKSSELEKEEQERERQIQEKKQREAVRYIACQIKSLLSFLLHLLIHISDGKSSRVLEKRRSCAMLKRWHVWRKSMRSKKRSARTSCVNGTYLLIYFRVHACVRLRMHVLV